MREFVVNVGAGLRDTVGAGIGARVGACVRLEDGAVLQHVHKNEKRTENIYFL